MVIIAFHSAYKSNLYAVYLNVVMHVNYLLIKLGGGDSLKLDPDIFRKLQTDFIKIFLKILFLGLCCCAGFSLVVESRGYSLVVVRGLLIVVASLVVEHRLYGAWPSIVVAPGL